MLWQVIQKNIELLRDDLMWVLGDRGTMTIFNEP
jgi:hypothetical protein